MKRSIIYFMLIFISSVVNNGCNHVGTGLLYIVYLFCLLCCTVMFVLVGVIAFQPQRPRVTTEVEKTYRIFLMPWLPAITVGLNALLAASLMPEIWPGIILWLGAGKRITTFLINSHSFIAPYR